MRLRPRRFFHTPEVMIIPMIDIMFFLLVFFMMGTLYMVQVKTVDVNLPQTAHSDTQLSVSYVVTIKKDGSLWLEDKPIDKDTLIQQAAEQQQRNPNFSVIIRADEGIEYGQVLVLLDEFKGAGITRFGLAGQMGDTP